MIRRADRQPRQYESGAAASPTITGGTGRFTGASGTLATAPMMTPRLPFSPPVLNEKLESAVHGFIDA